ncbi:Multidrug resistance protein 1 [Allomyces javanicus]|nr:Multidrug resistance protein 1 [Allomyces javanicus]
MTAADAPRDVAPGVAVDMDDIATLKQPLHSGPHSDESGSSTAADSVSADKACADTVHKVPYFQLFRFADAKDITLMLLGALGAIANGVSLPLLTIVLGDTINVFTVYDTMLRSNRENPGSIPQAMLDKTHDEFNDATWSVFWKFIFLAIGALVASYIQMGFWKWAGESQTFKIKKQYFQALLRQEIAFFDGTNRGELTSKIATDTDQIQDGIADKVGAVVQYMAMFVSALVIAFIRNAELTGILSISLPFKLVSAAFMGKLIAAFMDGALIAYAKAGAVAEEVLASLRTIVSFGGERRERARYVRMTREIAEKEASKGFTLGFGVGAIFLIMFLTYSLGFWWSARMLIGGRITVGDVVSCFMSFIIGSSALGMAAPYLSSFVTAQAAAYRVFKAIDRQSQVDPLPKIDVGLRPTKVTGEIEFKNVDFAYPLRPHVPILRNFNLKIASGTTVALVGQSGSGKSTCVGLLERYYVPASGAITLDGTPIDKLSIEWLRGQIGHIQQEPILFAGTIRENVALGSPVPVDDKQILDSLRMANAYNFVMDLPDKLDTYLGESGAALSGGQKQRIAIARALIRNPKIMLLDEATSALDTQSEAIVQEALDNAVQGRTTIVIAHRLSTIRNADMIVVMKKGVIVETGSHDALLAKQGYYADLIKDQQVEHCESDDEDTAPATETDLVDDAHAADDETHSLLQRAATWMSGKSARPLSKHAAHDVDDVPAEKSPAWRVLKLVLADQWHWILFGLFGAITAGSVTPVFAWFYADAVASYGRAYTVVGRKLVLDEEEVHHLGTKWGLHFVVIAVIACASNTIQWASFVRTGEIITMRMREMLFTALIGQEGAFYDRKENSVGALASKLSVESNLVRKLVGDVLGTISSVLVSLLVGCILALFRGWQLALLVIGCLPFVLGAGIFQVRMLRGLDREAAENEASQIASEAVANVRTIASLGLERFFIGEYFSRLHVPYLEARRDALVGAMAFSVSSAVMFIVYAVSFLYTGYLIAHEIYSFSDLFQVIMTIMFSAMMASRIGQHAPEITKAHAASISIFKFVDRRPPIDIYRPPASAITLDSLAVKGEIVFKDVEFRYPTRPKVRVHKGLNFRVPPGAKVALVGSSGCGKSMCIQLLERIYDVERGSISLDGHDLRSIDVNSLRSTIALVGQEPVLLTGTILDNIKYGAVNPDAATDEDVYEAARTANVHDFITSLPLGYQTPVGEKGGQLSGGQKQRVAIARALMRRPKVLLLDEATSALDAESEAVVQRALDAASEGRTTITIAHRLSTVTNSDLIIVMNHGRVVEQGTYKELVAKKGHFFALVQTQMEIKENK